MLCLLSIGYDTHLATRVWEMTALLLLRVVTLGRSSPLRATQVVDCLTFSLLPPLPAPTLSFPPALPLWRLTHGEKHWTHPRRTAIVHSTSAVAATPCTRSRQLRLRLPDCRMILLPGKIDDAIMLFYELRFLLLNPLLLLKATARDRQK